ncbi:MAG: DEAD/DEAH box helicase [Gammaproteobacteria bacterium]|nr:DEAD/DEAH box helicase [Gammaproteobacteria bacterium]
MPHEIRAYQEEGINFLVRSNSALLADEMGLGKTVQTIVAIRTVVANNSGARVLVVVPEALSRNWQEEFAVWAPQLSVRMVQGNQKNREASYLLPFPVLIATYDQVRIDSHLLDYAEKFEVVVLDEAQRIKSPSSSTSIACSTLPRRRSWALSGTPLENVTEDIVSIFSFVKPGILLPEMSSDEMQNLMAPYFLRRIKKDVIPELPPIIEQEVHLTLTGKQWVSYHEIWEARGTPTWQREKHESAHLLELIVKLKKVCNFDFKSGESVKLDALKTVIENTFASNSKLIVFSQFVETLKWLSQQLGDYSHDLYTGAMDAKVRHESIKRFRESVDSHILLISLKAGGVGLNLKEADTVVMFDRWWNPSVENQAVHRAHRFGRIHPLHVIKYLVRNSIEERIDEVLKSKRQLFKEYIDSAATKVSTKESLKTLQQILS